LRSVPTSTRPPPADSYTCMPCLPRALITNDGTPRSPANSGSSLPSEVRREKGPRPGRKIRTGWYVSRPNQRPVKHHGTRLSARRGVKVHAVLAGPVDTDRSRRVPSIHCVVTERNENE